MSGSKEPKKQAPQGEGTAPKPPAAKGGKRVVLKAIVSFALIMGAYYLIEYLYLLEGRFLQGYLSLIASTSARVLNAFGYDCTSQARWISSRSPRVMLEIVHGCDAMEPTVAYLAALLASPVMIRRKIPGILLGVPALLIINIGRIVTLFLVRAHKPEALDLMHYDVWQAAFIALAIVFWAIWVQWATRVRVEPGDVSEQSDR